MAASAEFTTPLLWQPVKQHRTSCLEIPQDFTISPPRTPGIDDADIPGVLGNHLMIKSPGQPGQEVQSKIRYLAIKQKKKKKK